MEAVLVDAFAEFEAALASVDSMPPGRAQIIASAHAYRNWALANRSRYLVMFTSHEPQFVPSPEVAEQLSRSLDAHTERVRAAVEAAGACSTGSLRAERVRPEPSVLSGWSPI